MEKSSVVFLLAGLIEPLGLDMPEQECERIILYYVAALVLVAQASSGSVFKTDERCLALDFMWNEIIPFKMLNAYYINEM